MKTAKMKTSDLILMVTIQVMGLSVFIVPITLVLINQPQ